MNRIARKSITFIAAVLSFAVLFINGCTTGKSTIDPDELREFATRYTAAWNSQDPASVAAHYAEDGSLTINDGEPSVGRAAITRAAQGFMTAFPDMVVTMDDLKLEGDQAIYHWTLTGTNAGPGGTGKWVRISGYEQWTIGPDGLIVASLGNYDEAQYQRQLQYGASSQYLFVWTADADGQDSDFVAVLDADPNSSSYGEVRTTIEVGYPARAHHSEHRMPADAQLFVNGYSSGRSYIVDLRDPLNPGLVKEFTGFADFAYPHSFERLPNGNVIATFQKVKGEPERTGGIVELTPSGEYLRSASAAVEGMPEIRPYSLLPLADRDLLVMTASDMEEQVIADSIQIWRLSDLTLLHTLRLPPGPEGYEHEHPAEPRIMADGETILVNTFSCGLYQLHDVESDKPRVDHIYTFEMVDRSIIPDTCSLAVTFGRFWVQTVPSRHGLVTLDLSDPANPREVAYLFLGDGVYPHWMALEPNERRIVLTGFGEMRHSVRMISVDPDTGQLAVDRAFGNGGATSFAGPDWPHGSSGAAVPHGSVFSNP
ncbi:MAG: selenium-binding protein SBP56-related protein [Woeseiaceae bacterium]|nr:selenium-binding protein SBP56-related protein [Woeseiaceae bacterium]